ncbi:ATPase [Erythrobacter sp. NE805]|uniref:ATPase n=1 Tax=Erythrobacter sp. NE805 TaxID=3389875 RepID=UPI00396B05B4
MTGRHQMRALGRGSGSGGADAPEVPESDGMGDEMLELDSAWVESGAEDDDAPLPSPTRFGWLAPALALGAVAGWTAFFAWALLPDIRSGASPREWAGWIVQWAVPVALIGIAWLLAMRSSQAEGRRFAATAAAMTRESEALEARLKVVNRELSLAREFIAAQARDLEALGRIAAERLSAHAGELQGLIATNGAQVEAIATTSETALGNMNRLRDDLPVIANAARDVANQIGSAGRVAEEQVAKLTGGFERLAAIGHESEARTGRLGAEFGAVLEALEARSEAVAHATEAVAARLAEASGSAEASFAAAIAALHESLVEKLRLVEELDKSTSASAQARIVHLRQEATRFDDHIEARNRNFDELIEQRRAAFETQAAQASELLAQRLAALDDELARRREAQLADIAKLAAEGEAMTRRAAELGRVVGEVAATSDAAKDSLGEGLGTLERQLADKRAALAATEAQLVQLTDSSVRLLEILQSGSRTCREDLATGIEVANAALDGAEARARHVHGLMLSSAQAGGDLSDYLLRARAEIDAADSAVADFRTRLAAETEEALARLNGLRGGFARLAEESGTLAGETQKALREALGTLEAAILATFATLDEGARERVPALAASLAGEAVEALEKTLRTETATTLGKLEQSAAHAAGVGREAAIQLRDQLVKVNELTGNLEQRVTRAREMAEEQVGNDFTRRMALITDSLNSAAIDISGALASDVADTAWDAYLKGDRGIFTRRAVSLLDKGTAKDIAALYTSDESFKANVSRYIHDFEALLRQTLSTRDGHVLSVTMLGSDMGKLYVALAQAIERLRT